MQTSKLDEPIISRPLTATVSPQLPARLTLPLSARSVSTADVLTNTTLALQRLADFQTTSGLKPIRRFDMVGWEESGQWPRPPPH